MTPASAAQPATEIQELAFLYEGRDYFALRQRLGAPSPDEPAGIRVLRAAAAHAFNELDRSDAILAEVFANRDSLSDSLLYEARLVRARNHLRLFRYGAAADVYEELAMEPPAFVDSADIREHRNMLGFTRALEGVPPQRVAERSDATLPLAEGTRVELAIGDATRRYAFDTGADFSAMGRSEAEGLGLEIRDAGIAIGTAMAREVTADVAVVDRLRLGGIELRNVVFLVLPDEMLSFPGSAVPGIVGFPVVEALGQVRFTGNGKIEIPAEVPEHDVRNLAFHDLSLYARVGYRGEDLLCALDAGSRRTCFLEPFYRRYRSTVEAEGTLDTLRATGPGFRWQMPVYRLPDVTLEVGGRTAVLASARVNTRPIWESRVVACIVGRDVLSSRGGYTLNFRSMSVLLD